MRRPRAVGVGVIGTFALLFTAVMLLLVAVVVPVAADAELQTVAVPNLTWVRTGGPLGGLGYDVRMRPDGPDNMLVTDAYAGVFRSADGGVTWQPSNTGITIRTGTSGDAIPVFCLTIDPHDNDIVWAGTQYLRGIFRSADGGKTWTQRNNGVVEPDGITFRGFTVDPRSSDIVYAAAELSSWQWNSGTPKPGREFDLTKGVVYKTTDGGATWTAVWRGDNLARYIWIDPDHPDTVYVSTGIFDREAANSNPNDAAKATPGGEGIVKSTERGSHLGARQQRSGQPLCRQSLHAPGEPSDPAGRDRQQPVHGPGQGCTFPPTAGLRGPARFRRMSSRAWSSPKRIRAWPTRAAWGMSTGAKTAV